ncbi:unnamed protein product [Adineta steineri]|uniref:G-protein coupled receptors family 1 profile domain-containing protein n=2 Tax=Adineta steineri TaxID=433720 RepID=A0A814EZU8_9BILA|nr:unnamed protein product [Adineta steineri]CAF3919066.1 unnamed protein product [Adineta steineri]
MVSLDKISLVLILSFFGYVVVNLPSGFGAPLECNNDYTKEELDNYCKNPNEYNRDICKEYCQNAHTIDPSALQLPPPLDKLNETVVAQLRAGCDGNCNENSTCVCAIATGKLHNILTNINVGQINPLDIVNSFSVVVGDKNITLARLICEDPKLDTMGSTVSSFPINFALLNQIINRYISIVLLFFGIIGNTLNILVFTRKIFRNNICVTYFLGSTIFDFLAIIIGLIPRPLNGFNVDPTQSSAVICKLKFFISYLSGYTAAWFIGFASIKRYLSSSTNVNTRQLITMKRARLSMVFVILFGFLAFGEQFYCIDINQNILGASQSCYQLKLNIQCQIADSLMQFLFQILAPTLMMIVFGSLTVRNIRRKHRRINVIQIANGPSSVATITNAVPIPIPQQSINNTNGQNKQPLSKEVRRVTQKREAQLSLILFIQIAVFVIASFPLGVYKVYSVATIYDTKSVLRVAIENTLFNIFVICIYLNNAIKFYIYTLSGTVFRQELMKLFYSVKITNLLNR